MKYAYYLAHLGRTQGDEELALGLAGLWDSFGGAFDGFSRYDGVSRFTTPEGLLVTRMTCQDFFSADFKVKVHDLPAVPTGEEPA